MKRTHRRRFLTEASAGSVFAALGALAGRIDQVAAAQAPRQGGDAELARRRSFSFLHTYEATGRYWRGLEKAGLIRHSTGVRLVNSPWGDDASRFNHVARLGGPLHQIIRQRRRPFIVDRICGGSPYHAYVFDAALVEAYVSLLGDNFLGGQLHEAVCNVANDWGRFLGVDSKYRHAPVDAARLRAHFDWGDSGRWLEYGTLDDYDGLVFPNSIDAFWAETMRSAKRQAARFQTRYSYCEGSHHGELSWPSFYKQGAGWCLAEVGAAASRRTQFMIASLRGGESCWEALGRFFCALGARSARDWLHMLRRRGRHLLEGAAGRIAEIGLLSRPGGGVVERVAASGFLPCLPGRRAYAARGVGRRVQLDGLGSRRCLFVWPSDSRVPRLPRSLSRRRGALHPDRSGLGRRSAAAGGF
jgi:hypothetical protein